ncbi:hypothetical protein KSS87_001227 [Heliosperma pusillum]|nr:hypothetical protein KSS87_001227 [Heliosperma pusillum]
MSEAQEKEVQITAWDKKDTSSPQPSTTISPSNFRRFEWRILITLFILFILLGQTAAVLLGRLYYNNGGKSKWMATLVQVVVWTALTWQLYSIGIVGLINKVSSLFSNVVATLGLPIVPVLAVIFFHDSMDGVKVVAMVLAIWGFVSYGYQQYLDYCKPETENHFPTFVSEA